MCLVSFNKNYRRSWMFPRNKRSIPPWKVSQILLTMLNADKNNWMENQNKQDKFYKKLEKIGLKKEGFQRDKNSGGARTYYSQLKQLGLVFRRKTRNYTHTFPTIAGEALINGEKPLDVMQDMLLKLQYPSAYGKGNNVKIHPELKVKPFLFILQLLIMKDIDKLSTEELAVPIIYGHNHDCLELCHEKIEKIKHGAEFIDILDNPDEDTYTPRTKNRTIEQRISSIMDVANTCKNHMESCLLVNIEKINGKHYITFNEDIQDKFEKALNNINNFIPFDNEEQFQRRLGAWNKEKDNRHLSASTTDLEQAKNEFAKNIIIQEFFKLSGNEKINEVPQHFFDKLKEKWGITESNARKTIEPYLDKTLDIFESTFLDLSRSGNTDGALKFEKALTKIFHEEFLFDAYHTGQDSSIKNRRGNYSDIFLVALDDKHCGIVDAKATSHYTFPVNDYNKMVNTYVPNYKELVKKYGNGRKLELEFCFYVAHGFSKSVDSNLKNMSNEIGIPASAIRARTVLDLSNKIKNSVHHQNFISGIKKKGLLSLNDFDIN